MTFWWQWRKRFKVAECRLKRVTKRWENESERARKAEQEAFLAARQVVHMQQQVAHMHRLRYRINKSRRGAYWWLITDADGRTLAACSPALRGETRAEAEDTIKKYFGDIEEYIKQ